MKSLDEAVYRDAKFSCLSKLMSQNKKLVCYSSSVLKDKNFAWSDFVLQSLESFTAHTVNKILILRQRNLLGQISLSQY